MDTNPIRNIRDTLNARHGKASVRASEGQLSLIRLVELICSHDDDTCQVTACGQCRAIFQAEAELKAYGVFFGDVVDLRAALAIADADARAGFLVDIRELPVTGEPQPPGVVVDLRTAS